MLLIIARTTQRGKVTNFFIINRVFEILDKVNKDSASSIKKLLIYKIFLLLLWVDVVSSIKEDLLI